MGLVGMGLRVTVSPAQNAFYIILVMLGILGNATVVVVIGKSVIKDHGGGRNSDIIIINMALSNLMVSLMRNTLLVISDMGLETLRRVAPNSGNLHGTRNPAATLLLSMGLIWLLNFIYSIPAHIFSTNGNANSTETLMLVSSTTRPLLGCVWNFPSTYSGLAYATTSIVIHEVFPIILMAITNMGSLYTLYTHGRMRTSAPEGTVIKRVPAERRAAKVILALIMLFIASWGTSIISVNYFNYNQGSSADFLLVIARFANIIFIAMSPAILAVGHRKLRSTIKSLLSH
ncbi:unnamed protein product [Pleuronectes platessa]|uniref:G-protein coupled receptors family 1 profile domain-containing protein n=1 Tax=Pleuronectes platessa TaxID=8262 RepID=A0A9N7YNH5_PLEPL|nr:unnamed protein product [Pleuronectes platessa]